MHFTFDNIRKLAQLADRQSRFNIAGQLDGLVQLYAHDIHSLNDTIDTFSAHHAIQRDVTKQKHIDGWQSLLKNLKLEAEKGKNNSVLQLHIICEKSGYLFFTTMDQQQLFGVLRFNNQGLSRIAELDENGHLRGTWTSRMFFLKGEELF